MALSKNWLKQAFVVQLEERLQEESPLIQVILGPRQVGKSTGMQMLEGLSDRIHYSTADDALNHAPEWIDEQWQTAKLKAPLPILVIDEIQKVMHWSGKIKALWDSERRKRTPFKLVLLGSSSLSLQRGLEESLAGRFEMIRAYHWTFEESQKQFNYSFENYLQYGGYPESAKFKTSFNRWQSYLKSSIIETVIGKDILAQATVRKPALFRQTFELLAAYPAQEISYTKLLGQLQESGNTDLVKHYIELFEGAFLFKSIQKYSGSTVRTKSSSPKIFPLCSSLYSYQLSGKELLDPEIRGRIFESLVGSELAKLAGQLFYWRNEKNAEVDFIYENNKKDILAIEVKSGRKKNSKGLSEFIKQYPRAKPLFITLENFEKFAKDPEKFFERALGT